MRNYGHPGISKIIKTESKMAEPRLLMGDKGGKKARQKSLVAVSKDIKMRKLLRNRKA